MGGLGIVCHFGIWNKREVFCSSSFDSEYVWVFFKSGGDEKRRKLKDFNLATVILNYTLAQ